MPRLQIIEEVYLTQAGSPAFSDLLFLLSVTELLLSVTISIGDSCTWRIIKKNLSLESTILFYSFDSFDILINRRYFPKIVTDFDSIKRPLRWSFITIWYMPALSFILLATT